MASNCGSVLMQVIFKRVSIPSDDMFKAAESSCLVVFQNLTFYLFQMMKFLDFGNNIDYLQIIV